MDTGPVCGPKIGVASDGTVEAKVGDVSAEFSSTGAVSGLFSKNGLSVSTDGELSYTFEEPPRHVGLDVVTVSVTATVSQAPEPPVDDPVTLGDIGHGLLDVLKVVGGAAKHAGEGCVEDIPACIGKGAPAA